MKWVASVLFCLFCSFSLQAEVATDHKLALENLPHTKNLPTKNTSSANYSINFSTNVLVNSAVENNQLYPNTVYDNQNQIWHAVWWTYNKIENLDQIYYSYSYDEGLTWSADERVDDSPSGAEYSCLTLDKKSQPAVAWSDYRNGGKDVYISRRTSSGWTPSIKVNTGKKHTAYEPSLAFRDGIFAIAWTDERHGVLSDIYTSTSIDLVHWTKNIRANDNLGYRPIAERPKIIINKNHEIYLVFNSWEGEAYGGRYPDVYFTKSTDGGKKWMSPQIRMNIETIGYQQDPEIAVDDKGRLYAVWEDDQDLMTTKIYLAKSTNNGLTWENKRVDDGLDYTVRFQPKIISNNNLYVAWGCDNRYNGYFQEIYFTYSSDEGNTWSANQRVNDTQHYDNYYNVNAGVALSFDNQGDIYCLWHHYHGDDYTYYDILSSKGTRQ